MPMGRDISAIASEIHRKIFVDQLIFWDIDIGSGHKVLLFYWSGIRFSDGSLRFCIIIGEESRNCKPVVQ
jgi:hypothetical protein